MYKVITVEIYAGVLKIIKNLLLTCYRSKMEVKPNLKKVCLILSVLLR
jgi:hypothetical protein